MANTYLGGADADTFMTDTLGGLPYDDYVFGFGGTDLIKAGGGTNKYDGGGDTDTVDYNYVSPAYGPPTGGVVASLDAGTGVVTYLDAFSKMVHASSDTFISIENLTGTAFTDMLTGDDGPNRLLGKGGDDTILGKKGDDTLLGGPGDDTLKGGEGMDLIKGQANNDEIYGGKGMDNLFGGGGDDHFHWEAGHGRDNYRGNKGYDEIHTDGSPFDGLKGTFKPGNSIEEIVGDSDFIAAGPSDWNFTKTNINSSKAFLDDFINRYVGQDGDDDVTGGAAKDVILGRTGNDSLKGGGGNDVLKGQGGDDNLIGNSGKDKLIGGAGDDKLNGGADKDMLTGGTGDDWFILDEMDMGIVKSTADVVKDFTWFLNGEQDHLTINSELPAGPAGHTLQLIESFSATEALIGLESSGADSTTELFRISVSGDAGMDIATFLANAEGFWDIA